MNRGFFVFVLAMFVLIRCTESQARALNIPENYEAVEPGTVGNGGDSGSGDRVNALELRLQDYEYTIAELKSSIQTLQENGAAEYQEKLALQQQIDLLIVGLNDLLNQYTLDLDNRALLEAKHVEQFDTLLLQLRGMDKSVTDGFTEAKEISVSGNQLITNMNDNLGDGIKKSSEQMLTELNETLSITNKLMSYLAVLLLLFYVVFISVFIGILIKNTVLKHIT